MTTVTRVLLLFLVGWSLFSNACPHGVNYNVFPEFPAENEAIISCPKGFIIDGTLTKCLRVATGYEDPCEESKQCSDFLSAGAVCQDGKCLCLDGYHYLHGECHKSKGLFESCEKDEDCFVGSEYNSVACIKNVCQCRTGFYQREYSTCRRKAKEINEDCYINSDCAFHENAICLDNKCILNEEAIVEGSKNPDYNKPEKIAKVESTSRATPPILVGGNCKEDRNCADYLPNSYCGAEKKCTCLRAHYASKDLTSCIPEIGEKCSDKDALHVEEAVCKDEQWTCPADRVNSKNNRLCNAVLGFDDKCKSNDLCKFLGPRAECKSKACRCNSTSHWIESESFCWITKKLDEECESDKDCFAVGQSLSTLCQEKGGRKVCSCPAKSHVSEDNEDKVCVADQTELGSYCAEDSDCKVKDSTCQSNKCLCADNYFESNKTCLPGLDAVCKSNTDCKKSNSVCFQSEDGGKCQCADNFIATPEKNCIKKSTFNESCSCNLQCSTVIPNSLCLLNGAVAEDNCDNSNTKTCECIKEDYYTDGACFKKKRLGEECSKKGECFTLSGNEHTVCRNSICSCAFEYKEDDNSCVPANYGSTIVASLWSMLLLSVLMYRH